MTEQEQKELELFKEWFKTIDKYHYQFKLQYEEAWFARAKLDRNIKDINLSEWEFNYKLDSKGWRQADRQAMRNFDNPFYWFRKIKKYTACNGSGYYDNTNNPICEACNGTGRK